MSQASPAPLDTDEIVDQIRAWIATVSPRDATAIGLDTDLIDGKYIDSLSFINLLLLVEELRGEEVPEASVDRELFRTLRAIKTNFLDRRQG